MIYCEFSTINYINYAEKNINKTVKYHIPQHGIYMYARTNSGKTELIVLNSTNTEQVVANKYYRMMTNDSKSGKELVSGKKIDLTRNMTVGARQSLIIEL